MKPSEHALQVAGRILHEARSAQLQITDDPAEGVPRITNLEHGGITVDSGFPDSPSIEKRFLHHRNSREKLKGALPSIDTTTKGKKRFLECGARAAVEFDQNSGHYKITSRTCGHRWCPACRQAFVTDLRAKLKVTSRRKEPFAFKFMTFTIRSGDSPLREQIAFLWKSFRRLRQTEIWKRRVKWGIAILEVTYSPKREQWHPHIHIIAEAGFIPCKALGRAWTKASCGSFNCDIKAIKSTSQAINYATKYATKGTLNESSTATPALTAELLNSLKRMKTILWFGNKPAPDEEAQSDDSEEMLHDWQHVCSLDHLLIEAGKGNQDALAILKAIDTGERGPPPPKSLVFRKNFEG